MQQLVMVIYGTCCELRLNMVVFSLNRIKIELVSFLNTI